MSDRHSRAQIYLGRNHIKQERRIVPVQMLLVKNVFFILETFHKPNYYCYRILLHCNRQEIVYRKCVPSWKNKYSIWEEKHRTSKWSCVVAAHSRRTWWRPDGPYQIGFCWFVTAAVLLAPMEPSPTKSLPPQENRSALLHFPLAQSWAWGRK